MFSLSSPSPNILIHGPCGSGKTSLISGILQEINKKNKSFIFLSINGLEDEKPFQIKEKIYTFTTTVPSNCAASKLIIIEELDSFSMNNQMSLRDILEKNNTEIRFFVTCTIVSKINSAVFSRCAVIRLKFPPLLFLMVRTKEICEKENFLIKLEDLKKILEFGVGDTMKILRVLSIFHFKKKKEKIANNFLIVFKFKKILKYSKEIFLKDFHFTAFKKVKKFSEYHTFSFSKVMGKLQIEEKTNISFF